MIDWLTVSQIMLVLVAGLLTSWTDLRYGRIRNVHTGLMAVAGLSLNGFSSGKDGMLAWWGAGVILAVLLSLLLWWRGLIPAGDAKLLMATSVIVPSWWYPDLAPGLFPFSIIFLVAFVVLVVPVIIRSWRISSGERRRSGPWSRWFGVKDGAELLSVALVPSWLFVVVWFGWLRLAPGFEGQAAVIAGAVGFMLASIASAETAALVRLRVSFSLAVLAIVGVMVLGLGGHPLVLVMAAAGGIILVAFTNLSHRMIESATRTELAPSEVHVGAVVVGTEGAEGASRADVDRLRKAGVPILVWQEVRFAHAVFAAVVIVGLIHLAEQYLPIVLIVETAIKGVVAPRW